MPGKTVALVAFSEWLILNAVDERCLAIKKKKTDLCLIIGTISHNCDFFLIIVTFAMATYFTVIATLFQDLIAYSATVYISHNVTIFYSEAEMGLKHQRVLLANEIKSPTTFIFPFICCKYKQKTV